MEKINRDEVLKENYEKFVKENNGRLEQIDKEYQQMVNECHIKALNHIHSMYLIFNEYFPLIKSQILEREDDEELNMITDTERNINSLTYDHKKHTISSPLGLKIFELISDQYDISDSHQLFEIELQKKNKNANYFIIPIKLTSRYERDESQIEKRIQIFSMKFNFKSIYDQEPKIIKTWDITRYSKFEVYLYFLRVNIRQIYFDPTLLDTEFNVIIKRIGVD